MKKLITMTAVVLMSYTSTAQFNKIIDSTFIETSKGGVIEALRENGIRDSDMVFGNMTKIDATYLIYLVGEYGMAYYFDKYGICYGYNLTYPVSEYKRVKAMLNEYMFMGDLRWDSAEGAYGYEIYLHPIEDDVFSVEVCTKRKR